MQQLIEFSKKHQFTYNPFLEFINYISNFWKIKKPVKQMSWQNAIVLKEGEQVVHSWEGCYEKTYKTMDGDFQLVTLGGHRGRRYREKEKAKPSNGVLVLTNRKLLWLEKRGLIGKSYHVLFEVPLTTLKGISMGGSLRKYVSVTDEKREYKFHLKGIREKELEPFKDMILRQAEKLKESPVIQKEVITKEVVMMPCDYCKALMPQTSTFCPNCGARRKG